MNKTLKKIIASPLVLLLMLLAWTSPVLADFGVSPSNIVHEQIRPGGKFQRTITLSRSDMQDDLEIIIEPSLDEMQSWATFEQGQKFIFPKGQQQFPVNVEFTVPEDAEFKHYEGVIRVKANPITNNPGGVSIIQGARIQVDIVVTNRDVVDLLVQNLKLNDVSGQDDRLRLEMRVTNNGTTAVAPWVKLTTINLLQEKLEELEARDLPAVNPNETQPITAEFDSQLGTGEYFALIDVMSGDQIVRRERLVFRVIDREGSVVPLEDKVAKKDATTIALEFFKSPIGIWLTVLFVCLIPAGYIILKVVLPEERKKRSKNKAKIASTDQRKEE